MNRRTLWSAALVLVASAGLIACGDDDAGSATTTPAPTTTVARQTTTTSPRTTTTAPPTTVAPTTTARPAGPTTTDDGGGGMSAGAPEFTSFTVTSPVPCQSGNATTTMSFTTMNVVEIEIKVGDGQFETTAGYDPDESAAVADIPCDGATESSIQLRGCTEDHDCVNSEQLSVTVTG